MSSPAPKVTCSRCRAQQFDLVDAHAEGGTVLGETEFGVGLEVTVPVDKSLFAPFERQIEIGKGANRM